MTSNSDGSIKLILGPMGASKTTNLILAIQRFQRQNKSTIIIKYTGLFLNLFLKNNNFVKITNMVISITRV